MDLTEAEDIKKRWQEYKQELYKKRFNGLDNHNGVITHLEPGILECEAEGALGSNTTNKASAGDGIPAELFQILKDDAVKVLHSEVATGLGKVSFHSNPKERQCQRMLNYHIIALISHVSKVMLKILQATFQQMFMLDLEKAVEPEIKLSTCVGLSNKQESSRKTSTSVLLIMPKL